MLCPGPLRRRARERNRCGWTAAIGSVRRMRFVASERVPSDRSSRHEVLATQRPERADPGRGHAAARNRAEAVHPEPEPATAALAASAQEAERPRGWFGWRRGDATEPVTTPEPAEPRTASPSRQHPRPANRSRGTAEPAPDRLRAGRTRACRHSGTGSCRRPPSSPTALPTAAPRPRPKRPSRAAGSPGCAPACRAARPGSTRASTRSSPAAGSTPPRSKNSKSC